MTPPKWIIIQGTFPNLKRGSIRAPLKKTDL